MKLGSHAKLLSAMAACPVKDRRNMELHDCILLRIGLWKTSRRAALWIAGLMIVSLAVAQTPKAGDETISTPAKSATNELKITATQPAGGGAMATNLQAMTVTVLDAQTGRGIAGAKVWAPYAIPFREAPGTNDWGTPTDENGVAVVSLARSLAEDKRAQNFSLSVLHSNYAPRDVMWISDSGNVGRTLPPAHALKLERGITIGGFVRDENGAPVPGARMVPWGNGYRGFSLGTGVRQSQEYSSISRNEGNATITDARGFWTRANIPTDLQAIRIEVIRPAGARVQFATDAQARQLSVEPAETVSLADLRATNAGMVLKNGFTVRGMVVDEAGKPLARVRLKERPGRTTHTPPYVLTNGTDGRFELPHRTALQFVLTAEADGLATKTVFVTPASDAPEVRIVLPPAKPLRVRVLGERDEPVVGAALQIVDWRSGNQVLDWRGATDAEGRVVWTNAPDQEVSFWIQTTNYPVRGVKFLADGTERTVRLRQGADQAINVRVKAQDATTGEALKSFVIRRNVQWGEEFKDWGRPGDDGEFRSTIATDEFQRGTVSSFRVRVGAEGYAPWTSDHIYFEEGDQDLTVKLKQAPAPAGVVLQPDGRPAENAKVLLNTANDSLFANTPGGEFFTRPGVLTQRTGKDGAFRFDAAEELNRLLATHPTGFASVTVGEFLRAKEIRLLPWARVEGILRVGGKPLANERVSVKSPINWASANTPGQNSHLLVFSTSTDAAGRFSFTNLPPGDYLLYRTPHVVMGTSTVESHRLPFDLSAGETKRIDYGFGGRRVVGHVETSAPVDWQNDSQVLALKLPEPPPAPNYYAFADHKEFEKARNAYGQLPAVREHARKEQQFQLVFDREGNFKMDDVPPGTYALRLRVTKPPENPNMRYQRNEQELASLVREVTIPSGAPGEEFGLGMLELEVKETVASTRPAASFKAAQLDGKPFDSESLRGKPAVMLFWANWAPQSAERLAALQKLRDGFTAKDRIEFVTVNLDEDVATARNALKGLESGWTHTRLDGPARSDITEQLAVDTLPTLLLLDAQGRMAARDPETRRLSAALERLLKQGTKK